MYVQIYGGVDLLKIFQKLDEKVTKVNREFREDSSPEIPRFYIKILGQTALIEAHLGLNLFATIDVDAYANFNWLAKTLFADLLLQHHLVFDELSSEIWMPEETEYVHIFRGDNFDGYIAQHEYVLISKLLKAPEKNLNIIIEYIAKKPSDLFFKMCQKYKIDLKELLK